jgi:hypothetical protein
MTSEPSPLPSQKKAPWGCIIAALICTACATAIVLAPTLFSVFAKARLAAQAAEDLSSAKKVSLALAMYENDNDDSFPSFLPIPKLERLLDRYLKDRMLVGKLDTYEWNQSLSGTTVTAVIDPATMWVLCTKEADPTGKYNVGFADGTCRRVSREELAQIKTYKPPVNPAAISTGNDSN